MVETITILSWPSLWVITWYGGVTPALHTPLMAVTNALSSIIVQVP